MKARRNLKFLPQISIPPILAFLFRSPGGLQSAPATGNGVLTEDVTVCGAIMRADVARLVAKCLFSDKANGKTLSAVDKNQVFDGKTFAEFNL